MPILDVEIVCSEHESLGPELAQRLADAAGGVLGAEPGHTWVRLRILPRAHYAESGGDLAGDVRPVFVELLQADPPAEVVRAQLAVDLAAAVARETGRSSDHVHLLFLPAGRGRIAFGGQLRS